MRQEVEARGGRAVAGWIGADVCVVNTCTVTNQADAEARRFVRRLHRENPDARLVIAGCSAVLRAPAYRKLDGVSAVVPGHDPVEVAGSVGEAVPERDLVHIAVRRPLDHVDTEPVGAELLRARRGATRGWLKIQDGCDRRCSFCATRLARGSSRSRDPEEVVAEALLLARSHPELVVTGIHIGHYGRDLEGEWTLSRLVALLLERVPGVRLRLGSVEATEVDDLLLDLLEGAGGHLAPHLHMPLQSGADPVLRRMRRWHTRDMYRRRALDIAGRVGTLGLGADVIAGFPGETEDHHAATLALVEELPFTYLHVFPFSPREGTGADELWRNEPVPQRVAGERARELREVALAKGEAYRRRRTGGAAEVSLEGGGSLGLTGDYLRVGVIGAGPADRPRLHRGVLGAHGDHLYIDLSRPLASN